MQRLKFDCFCDFLFYKHLSFICFTVTGLTVDYLNQTRVLL